MDADDLISPIRFEKQIEVLNRYPNIDLVTTGICSLTNNNIPVGIRGGSPNDTITGRKLILGECAVVHAAMLGRKSWFLRNKYDETINRTEDYELWLRAFSKNDFKLHIISEPLYYYREEENVTASRQLTAYSSQRHLYKEYGSLWLNKNEIRIIIAKSFCKSLIVHVLSACGKMDVLLKRRNKSIEDQKSTDYFVREINQIFETKVPGLD